MTPPTGHVETGRSSELSAPARPEVVDPLQYPDWDTLVAAHERAGVVHGTGWARVLQSTYGHRPHYICRFEGRQLAGLLAIMEVSSRWTGRRGVSLPFMDFCPALKAEGQDLGPLYEAAMELGRERRWRYLECRSAGGGWAGAWPSLTFHGHVIDLAPGAEGLFNRLDSTVRRGIRKAEAAGLRVEFSGSLEAVRTFYGLHCRTRRRHGLPPQPLRFFENIQRHVLEGGRGLVATVRRREQPLAAAVFFCDGRRALYKYGASDYAFQQLRPNHLLMWAALRHCAAGGLLQLHLGRTSLGNEGLRRFKLSLGASEETVAYCRYDFSAGRFVRDADRAEGWFNRVFALLPLPLLRLAGRILYPHLS
jgi:hypothetical protein